ncbi:MAG: type III-A CRISPR-associated RAMP protein Csm4 [Bacteroidota bacterium]|nr:type III-A CRISPR-associated RAMP protein Csm4 [Bacteroidota bacterium]
MAELSIYKLHFTTPLHISNSRSDYGVSLKTIDSDTMYAAITSCLAKLGVDIPSGGDLGFTISSLFPYYQKDKDATPVYFFPRPLQSKLSNIENADNRKEIKKIKYIDSNYFSTILTGEDFKDFSEKDIKGTYLYKGEIDSDFITSKVNQRVILEDRTMQSEAKPYYVERISFKDYSGLYFIVQGDTSLLDKVLPLLALEGIGTDRNIGNGFFEFSKDKISLNIPKKTSYCVCLSMFFPESKEQLENLMNKDDEKIAYEIRRRGGWITTYPYLSLRKNYIYGFSCGSVFSKETCGLEALGKIVDLRPQWNDENLSHIFRCGRSLILPINV